MTERWAAAPGLPGYEVSDLGRVRRWVTSSPRMRPLDEPAIVPVRLGHNGYLKFTRVKDGRTGTTDLHRVVGEAFLGPAPSPAHHVDHRDRDRTNCVLSNLKWSSPSENNLSRGKMRSIKHLASAVRWARVIDGKSYGAIAREFDIDHKQARIYANAPA